MWKACWLGFFLERNWMKDVETNAVELFACAVQCLSGNGALYRRWIIRSNYRSGSVHWKGCRDCSAADAVSGFLHAQAASLSQRSQTWKFPLPAPWYVTVDTFPLLLKADVRSYWWATTTWIYQWLRHATTINKFSHPETPELRTKGPIANTLLKIIDFGLSKCFDEGVLQIKKPVVTLSVCFVCCFLFFLSLDVPTIRPLKRLRFGGMNYDWNILVLKPLLITKELVGIWAEISGNGLQ